MIIWCKIQVIIDPFYKQKLTNNIINVKEEIKVEDNSENEHLSIKEEPAQNENAYDTVNIKKEESGDFLLGI